MNLEQIRHLFRTISGRYDLTEADAGQLADFYINEGSKWLDKQDEVTNSWASYMEELAVGTWYVQFPRCRAIKEVWMATASGGRWQLEKKDLQDMLTTYMSVAVAEMTNGTAYYYSPTYARYIPESISNATLTTFMTYINLAAKASYGYNTVIFSAPIDIATLVDIKGLFYSRELIEDTDENFWSVENPLLLALAAVRQVHMSTGNLSALKNVHEPLKEAAAQLGMDLVEQLIAEVDQMEG